MLLRVRRFSLKKFFSSKRIFAHIFPDSNINWTLGYAGFACNFFQFEAKRFLLTFSLFQIKTKPYRVCRFCFQFLGVLSETVFDHIFPLFKFKRNKRRTLLYCCWYITKSIHPTVITEIPHDRPGHTSSIPTHPSPWLGHGWVQLLVKAT